MRYRRVLNASPWWEWFGLQIPTQRLERASVAVVVEFFSLLSIGKRMLLFSLSHRFDVVMMVIRPSLLSGADRSKDPAA